MFQFNGFRQVVKSTGFNPFNTVGCGRLPGQQYDLGLWIFRSDIPQDLDAGHTGHLNVQHHHIHRFFLKNRQAFIPV